LTGKCLRLRTARVVAAVQRYRFFRRHLRSMVRNFGTTLSFTAYSKHFFEYPVL
jgi:hypothetical protein